MIKLELTARVLLHILLEGHGFVAAAGNASLNEQDKGKAIAFPRFCCMQLITIDVPCVFSHDIYMPVARL